MVKFLSLKASTYLRVITYMSQIAFRGNDQRHFVDFVDPKSAGLLFFPSFCSRSLRIVVIASEHEFHRLVPSKTAGIYNKHATRTLESSGVIGIIIVFESGGD